MRGLVLYKFIDKVKRIKSERLGIIKGPYPLNIQLDTFKCGLSVFQSSWSKQFLVIDSSSM